MNVILGGAWALIKILSYGGFAAALLGVAVFGWYFVQANARAARTDASAVPPDAWRGKGALRGLKLLACGAGMQIASILLSAVVPGRL